MAQGTPLIFPINIGWNNNGSLSAGAIATFYLAGTVTLVNIYADVSLTIPLANPLTADGNGRFPEIYVTPGVSYKIKLTDANGVALDGYPADNIPANPTSSSNQELTGTAGETLTTGQVVYESDGSGSKTPGLWYKADAANTYSSTTTMIGMVPSTITAGSSGVIRTGGSINGLLVSVGQNYYVGTAGFLATIGARFVGQADTTTSLVLAPNPPPAGIDNGLCEFRLTLTSGVPVTTSDVTGATTLYCSPYKGNRLSLFNAAGVSQTFTSAEFSIAIPATTSTMYDVFVYNNVGVPTLELLSWTNDTTRATGIGFAGVGVYVKFGDFTRRYIGTFRTTTVSGQSIDARSARYVWNYYNRVNRDLLRLETTSSWNYNTATVRQANNSTANQVDVVVGVVEDAITIGLKVLVSNSGGGAVHATVGLGLDSTTLFLSPLLMQTDLTASFLTPMAVTATLPHGLGRHFYSWNEYGVNSGTTTWYGVDPTFGGNYYGITGMMRG